jgi:hypothetical protein
MGDAGVPEAGVNYDDAPLRLFHLRVAVASCGGVFSDGYGLGIIGISLSRAPPQLGLSPVWLGLLGGASLFGLFAGALLTGPAADRFGRRPIFAYNMALLAALSLLQGLEVRHVLVHQDQTAVIRHQNISIVILPDDLVLSFLRQFALRRRRHLHPGRRKL